MLKSQIKSAPNGFGFDLSIHMSSYSKCGELDVSPHMSKKKMRGKRRLRNPLNNK